MNKVKILIIKMGYSETLDYEVSKVVSLGDVLRCTVVLEPLKEKYPHSHITWLVSGEAMPLLAKNKFIDRLFIWDEFTPYVLMREKYDIVINLEKINGVCALTDMIDGWEKIGFRFNSRTGEFDTYMQSMVAKEYLESRSGNGSHRFWQEVILDMLGLEWKKQEYSLGYEPVTGIKYDVGLNHEVGNKWPTKGMSRSRWEELEKTLSAEGFTVSWQRGMNNLFEYMDWINSCRIIVTGDSLGLHLALALKKRAVVLFGPTTDKETYMYDRGIAVMPKTSYDCLPCYKQRCSQKTPCMDMINLKEVVAEIKKRKAGKGLPESKVSV